jgi:hypothetical protein
METINLRRPIFRPSTLDGLALCGFKCGDEAEGVEAKAKGNKCDAVYRAGLQGRFDDEAKRQGLTDEEKENVLWAIGQTRELADGAVVLSDKRDCAVAFPKYFDQPGEADAIIPMRHCHLDYKSGQEWDYRLQQTAYAYGFMSTHFLERWSAFVLYGDQRRVVSYSFTDTQAEAIIKTQREFYDRPGDPIPNELCHWCANFNECPALTQVADASFIAARSFDFDAVLADPVRLGRFLVGCNAIEEYAKRAKVAALARIIAGEKIPGWKMVSRKGNEYVPAGEVFKLGIHNFELMRTILETYGTLGGTKYRELCETFGVAPDESVIKRAGGSVYLRQTKS